MVLVANLANAPRDGFCSNDGASSSDDQKSRAPALITSEGLPMKRSRLPLGLATLDPRPNSVQIDLAIGNRDCSNVQKPHRLICVILLNNWIHQ